jgi:recombination protein RecT
VAITALTRNPKLLECTQASLFRCLLDLSALGLEPDDRRAYLIPYGKECTLIVSYKGLLELVLRNENVLKIHAEVVCQNDVFTHALGEVADHTFPLGNRGKVIGAYAQATLKDGMKQAAIMSLDEINAIMHRSSGYKSAIEYKKSHPWVTDFNEMAKKTAVRRLSKMLVLTPELADQIQIADEHEFAPIRERKVEARTVPLNPFEETLTGEDA